MNQHAAIEAWTVGSQQEATGQDSLGHYVPGVNVSFQTVSGMVGSVFVPNTQYNADTVRQMIAARVARMVAVRDLEG